MSCDHSFWLTPETCTSCLHGADERRVRLEKAAKARLKAAAPEALTATRGVGADPVAIRVDEMLSVHEGGKGTRCVQCQTLKDERGFCRCGRVKRSETAVDEIQRWLDGIDDPKVRKGQKYVVMSATRRLAYQTGRDTPVRVGKQTVPLIAVASYGARATFGHPASWAPVTNSTADENPL